MKKEVKIERVTCICGQVIAGCVHGEQDARWETDRQEYVKDGCNIDIVAVEVFKFGKCQCENVQRKQYFKVLAIK